MQLVYRSQLPCPEDDLRADLAAFLQEVAAHAATVGVPAPFPKYEILRNLQPDFVVVENPEAGGPQEVRLVVTPWQFRKALNQQGLRQAVEDAVAASDDQDLKDGWEFATEFVRDDPFVVGMAAAIGKTAADLDALFELAKTL